MPKRNIIWFLAVVAAAIIVAMVARREPLRRDADSTAFHGVQQAYSLIRSAYVEPVDDDKLRRLAIEGMVRALDPFSVYIPPDQAEGFERRVTYGKVQGVGFQTTRRGEDLIITLVQPNSPAHRGGLLPEDRIVRINGQPTRDMKAEEVEKLLKGPLGAKIELTVASQGQRMREVTLRREEFAVESVEGLRRDDQGRWVYMLAPRDRLAYIRIQEFIQDTDTQLQIAYRSMNGPRALIVDLRGNPGGSLDAAVRVADLFLRDGLIVSAVGRDQVVNRRMAHGPDTFDDIPLVMLVDEKTASAAEIVCGAMKLHQRAVLVGSRTRGKGCVQSLLDLGDGLGKISLTTSQFYLGRLGCITRRAGAEKWGIDPDVLSEIAEADLPKLTAVRRAACSIRRPASATQPHAEDEGEKTTAELLVLDAPLARAEAILSDDRQYKAILQQALAACATAPADHD